MFSNSIVVSPLLDESADQFFPNVQSERFRENDISLCVVARALLAHRDHDAFFSGKFFHGTMNGYSTDSDCRSIVRSICSYRRSNTLSFVTIDDSFDEMCTVFDNPDSGFVKSIPDYYEALDLRVYFSKLCETRVYISDTRNACIIFVKNLTVRKLHFIESAMPRLIPWLVELGSITDAEKELLASLTERTSDHFESLIQSIYDELDFRSVAIRNMLDSFQKRIYVDQKMHAENERDNLQHELQRNIERYRSLIDSIFTIGVTIDGLNTRIENVSGDDELIDFFISRKDLSLVEVYGQRIKLIVKTYLESFDPDVYDTIGKNPRSFFWGGHYSGVFANIEDRRLLLNAIFGDDPSMRIKVCAYYDLDMRGEVETISGYIYPSDCAERLPNPHIHNFSCLGDHRRYINERLRNGDIIGAIEQCVGSAKSINLAEQPTVSRFVERLFSAYEKCIELSDGRSVSPAEALAILKGN